MKREVAAIWICCGCAELALWASLLTSTPELLVLAAANIAAIIYIGWRR